MTTNDLDELIKDREEQVAIMKKNCDNSHRLLAKELYEKKETHFISELLQNAEDEGAKNVFFTLNATELIFEHDAPKLFDYNDITAISNFGANEGKKSKPNAIGRFGIGFKSVYSITDNPRIISGDFDITIYDYIVPKKTNEDSKETYHETKIILPFNNEQENDSYTTLNQKLNELDLHYLLFLSNIRNISWIAPNEKEEVYEKITDLKDKRFITLKSPNKEFKYFVVEREIVVDTKVLTIKIAFKFDNEQKTIIPCDKSPLFSFFPTEKETNLKFLIHAPFRTTPARDNIQEDEINDKLLLELGKLLADSLSTLKELGLLNVNLLNLLPIDKANCDRSNAYKILYKAVKEELKSDKELLPTTDNNFSSANDTILLGSSDLADLLKKEQTQQLFSKTSWISRDITNDRTKVLRDYLYQELKIPEYDLASFANKIDTDFLKQQPDEWLIEFYKVVNKAQTLYRVGAQYTKEGVLRTKPIIRTESGEQVTPFQNDGKPNVFLPTQNYSQYKTVKKSIANNEDARRFLEELGLTTPDIFAEINEFIISKLKAGILYDEYYDDLKKILNAIKSKNNEQKERLIQDLKNYPFILAYNAVTKDEKLLKSDEVYMPTEELKTYFDGYDTAFFVANDKYISLVVENENELISFWKELDINTVPRRIPTNETYLLGDEKRILRSKSDLPNCTRERISDYKIEGLDYFINNISIDRSVALWKILSMSSNDYLLGKYEWESYNSNTRSESFTAFYIRELKKTKWLYDENDKIVLPSEITVNQLSAKYNIENIQNQLSSYLGFKRDEVKAIEEKLGGKFVVGERLKKFEQWEAEQDKKNGAEKENKEENINETKFNPSIKPEDAELNETEFEGEKLNIKFDTNQGQKEQVENDNTRNTAISIAEEKTNTINDCEPETYTQKDLKGIGKWGEGFVLKSLKEKYKLEDGFSIDDLNREQTGKGCDFQVKKNNEIIALVEVKSTIESQEKTFTISGVQWEVARENENKYWIYCVFNAGENDAKIVKIQNPIQKWKDGELMAHPVNFIVK